MIFILFIFFSFSQIDLAESDIAYTEAITGNQRQDYKGKDVLVLGAGDGGILHYLRQQDAGMITMVEISFF